MTTMTRRQAITAIASVSATGVATAALAAAPATDDVSALAALIEAHKAAYQAFDASIDREHEMEEAYNAANNGGRVHREILVPLSIGGGATLHINHDHQEEGLQDCRARIEKAYDEHRKRLAQVERILPPSAKAHAKAELRKGKANDLRSMHKALKEEQGRRDAFGYGQALRDREAASDAEENAALALLAHHCRSASEILMRADYLTAKYPGRLIHEALYGGAAEYVDALLLSTTERRGDKEQEAA